MLNKIKDIYSESIQIQISASSLLPNNIIKSAESIVNCLLRNNKVIVCGHGRSHANAQFLVANLLNRYDLQRPSFASILLSLDGAVGSSIISDESLNDYYGKQFNAIARTGDLLVVFSPLGNEEPILNIIRSALEKDIHFIVLTGLKNDHIKGFLTENDIELSVPTLKESRILENHLFIINSMCELIDHKLFSHP